MTESSSTTTSPAAPVGNDDSSPARSAGAAPSQDNSLRAGRRFLNANWIRTDKTAQLCEITEVSMSDGSVFVAPVRDDESLGSQHRLGLDGWDARVQEWVG